MTGWIDRVGEVLGQPGRASGVALVAAFAVAVVVTVFVRRLGLRLGAVDLPGGRHLHCRPTVRLGGLAVLAAMGAGVVAVAVLQASAPSRIEDLAARALPVLAIGAAVCAFGAWDDLHPVPAPVKLAGVTAAALLLVLAGVKIEVVALPWVGRVDLGWAAVPATLCWVVACMNAVNLIDGIDGAGSAVSMVSAGALGLVALGLGDAASAVIFFAVCGAAAGFLVHNRQPATIFLGDSGSLLLGFVLAATSAAGCGRDGHGLSLVAALLALAVPILDTTQSFVRRFRRVLAGGGRRRLRRAVRATMVADREHIHHRLLSRGLSDRQATRVLCLVTCATGLTALLLLGSGRDGRPAFLAATLAGACMLLRLALLRGPGEAPRPADRKVVLPAGPGPGDRPRSVLRPRYLPRDSAARRRTRSRHRARSSPVP